MSQPPSQNPIFATVLGADFDALAAPIRDLHDVASTRMFAGRSAVVRGRGMLSRLVGALIGFPPAGADVPVRVRMERQGTTELWTRDFGGRVFRSRLSPVGEPGSRHIYERFGLVVMTIKLTPSADGGGGLAFPVVAGSLLGVPLPRLLLPRSDTWEHVDDHGRAAFDVTIGMPLVGHIVTYRGWLVPEPTSGSAPMPS